MTSRLPAPVRLALGPLLALLLVLGYSVPMSSARADSAPVDPADPATPATVTADALPTVQINGVVWEQAVVGNTVYAGGSFTRARPAGAAPGTQETVRNNLLAYDLRTGELNTSFAPNLNAQVLAVAASPDGSTVYVGGDFTQANGQARYRLAAYSTATGALLGNFAPTMGGEVTALAVSDTTVYVGGIDWGSAGGAGRNFLAAFDRSTGAVLPWAPSVDSEIDALALVNGGASVVVGGHLSQINGATAHGLGRVDARTGQNLPLSAALATTNGSLNSGFTDLASDGDTMYATGYSWKSEGNLEGVLAFDPNGGAVRWVDDCHGDSYSVYSTGSVVYQAGHHHSCPNIAGFPQINPTNPGLFTYLRGVALTKAVTGKVGFDPPMGGTVDAFQGQPSPSMLAWYPDFAEGSYTGQYQGPWSVAGTSQYVVYGGEFPTVNGAGQQGLARFAVPSIAPNKVGPDGSSGLDPTLASTSAGTVRVSWQTTSDKDNQTLNYDVYRSDSAQPIFTTTAASSFWAEPQLSFLDQTAPAGTTVSYYVVARDAFGNKAAGPSRTITVSSAAVPAGTALDDYARSVVAGSPTNYWRLDEASGNTLRDQVGTFDLTRSSGVTLARTGALSGRPDTAATFNGSSSGVASTRTAVQGPNQYSLEAWFSTTSTAGGQLLGFGDTSTGLSNVYDRQITLDSSGRVSFAVVDSQVTYSVRGTAALNDGKWHHVVATAGTKGISLYLDGALAGTNATPRVSQINTGYWKVGGDRILTGTGTYLSAGLDELAVYPYALTAAQVSAHRALGTATPAGNAAPTASFTVSANGLVASVDASASTDPEGPIASYGWDFGDGQTGTGRTASHTYAAAGTYSVKLTVTDSAGATGTVTKPLTVTAQTPPAAGTLGADAFGREVTGGWGPADAGGAWTISGTAANAVVTGGSGRLTAAAGATIGATLPIAARDVSLTADVSVDKAATGGGTWYALGSRNSGSSRYNAQLWFAPDATAMLSLIRIDGGAETDLGDFALPGSYTAGSVLKLRFETVGAGTTTLRARAWASGTTEPTTWQLSATDTTVALQGAGGLYTELYPSKTATAAQTVRLDNLVATAPGTTPANTAPTASFTSTVTGLAAALDASASTDAEGPVTTWAWEFGDGQTGTGKTASHTYAAAGTYSVKLTVTDSAGATGTVTKPVTVSGGATNTSPTASFLSSVDGLVASVDASASTDPEGPVASWAWAFGDGQTGTGKTASHTYAAAGTYSVTLTVTDSAGATGTVTKPVTVTAQAPPPAGTLATDAFGREATGGWGSADAGGAWTISGTTANAVVTGGSGRLTAAAGNTMAATLPISAANVSMAADVALDKAPTGGGSFIGLAARNSGSTRYNAQLWVGSDGSAWLSVFRLVNGAETDLGDFALPGKYTAGSVIKIRFEISGSGTTALRAKAWASGSAEPTAWQLSLSDSTAALQAAGGLRAELYTSASATAAQTLRMDNLSVTAPGTGTPNVAPTASFTSSVSGLVASVDASGSSDPEGALASYAWQFGDGQTGSGKTASHTYAAAGTYSVKLTVTDSAGATGDVTRSVTVSGGTQPPANVAPTASFTSSVSALVASVDGSGSTDPEGPVASWAWEFGDGQTGTGKTASHTYAAAGTYSVKLTVTDSAGATGTVTKPVTVTGGTTPPPAGTLAMDAFGREVTGGWGSADAGGAWTVVGTAANAVVTGGSGRMTAAAGTTIATQLGLSARDVGFAVDVALDRAPSGGGSFIGLGVRNVGASRYTAQLWVASDGTAMLSVFRVSNGAETDLGDFVLPGKYTAGSVIKVRFEASGSGTTALRAKAWSSGTAEPSAWQLSVSDTTAALQVAGGLRTELYTSSSATAAQTLRLDNLWVGPSGQTPPAG